jgi:AcrR family transcriptional regulator
MTMEQVATKAGIAKGTVYLYFTSKQSLLAGLQADLAQSFLDGPSQAMADESCTWLDRLDAVVRRRLEVRLTHSRLYHELFHVHSVPDAEEPLKQVRALIGEILERGQEAGEFDVEDVTVTTDFLLHASGGACDHVDRSDEAEVAQTIQLVQKLFHRVVCASSAGTRRRRSRSGRPLRQSGLLSQVEPTSGVEKLPGDAAGTWKVQEGHRATTP